MSGRYWPIVITKNKSLIYTYLHNLIGCFDRNPIYRTIIPNTRLSKITRNTYNTVSAPSFEKNRF